MKTMQDIVARLRWRFEAETKIVDLLAPFECSEACQILGSVALSLGHYAEARRLCDVAERLDAAEQAEAHAEAHAAERAAALDAATKGGG